MAKIQVVNIFWFPDSSGCPGRNFSADSQPSDPVGDAVTCCFCRPQLKSTAVLTLLLGTSHEGCHIGITLQSDGVASHEVGFGLKMSAISLHINKNIFSLPVLPGQPFAA